MEFSHTHHLFDLLSVRDQNPVSSSMKHPVLVDSELIKHTMKFNPNLLSNFCKGFNHGDIFQTLDLAPNHPLTPSVDLTKNPNSVLFQGDSPDGESPEVPDFSDACLKFISDILLEEDLDESPVSVQEFRALHATEKILYDVLGEKYPSSDNCISSLDQSFDSPDEDSNKSFSNNFGVESYAINDTTFESNCVLNQTQFESFLSLDDISHPFVESNSQSSGSSDGFDDSGVGVRDGVSSCPVSTLASTPAEKGVKLVDRSRRKKNHKRDDGFPKEGRNNKHQASYNDDYVEMEQYDDILLCKEDKTGVSTCTHESSPNEASEKSQKKGSKGKTTTRGKKQSSEVGEEVDLRALLSQCAQAVSSFDLRSANELLKQIRQHSSPYGDSIQRLSHHFANGLEARLAGTGSTFSPNLADSRISSSEFLKGYRRYVTAIPFKRMSFFVASNEILKLAEKATKIHIIDFGVNFGIQWPCFIQALSERPMGPPRLRITGIEYPQHGFRPAERIEATGRRLSGYCDRFNVPFQYKAIAEKWENIQPEGLKIESDELVIVNCMFRSGTLLDETVEASSPRDAFLRLIKQLNPRLFIHGVINGTFNAPFFITRFKEALFHYSSTFDVFEATMPREDHERLLIESEMIGKEVVNVIACEGVERVQRPETYKHWQLRTVRAGLRQLPLDKELMSSAKAKVKANYHKDFVVDEDRNWMLHGWKGRIYCALSFWETN